MAISPTSNLSESPNVATGKSFLSTLTIAKSKAVSCHNTLPDSSSPFSNNTVISFAFPSPMT